MGKCAIMEAFKEKVLNLHHNKIQCWGRSNGRTLKLEHKTQRMATYTAPAPVLGRVEPEVQSASYLVDLQSKDSDGGHQSGQAPVTPARLAAGLQVKYAGTGAQQMWARQVKNGVEEGAGLSKCGLREMARNQIGWTPRTFGTMNGQNQKFSSALSFNSLQWT